MFSNSMFPNPMRRLPRRVLLRTLLTGTLCGPPAVLAVTLLDYTLHAVATHNKLPEEESPAVFAFTMAFSMLLGASRAWLVHYDVTGMFEVRLAWVLFILQFGGWCGDRLFGDEKRPTFRERAWTFVLTNVFFFGVAFAANRCVEKYTWEYETIQDEECGVESCGRDGDGDGECV
ncbi:hypothetical protein FN846DRAFT_982425 [Sphaerosporella brunnea]|uniref:Uncharacterized protein n=1 Tax=Sphaerosporella brunnea TaxID=1250544 RepID=A0A5J5EBU6_9PEZI|nr:hypothetical protein FN846DRAFT_982425 [Sphaerosporella brunnea]